MLPTLYDGRTNHARAVLETISETYDLDVIEPPIPKTIKFAEAPAAGPVDPARPAAAARARRPTARWPRTSSARAAPVSRTGQGERRATAHAALDAHPHRADVRPRYGRIVASASSLAVTVVAVLGGVGALPSAADDADRRRDRRRTRIVGHATGAATPDQPTATPARQRRPARARRRSAAGRRRSTPSDRRGAARRLAASGRRVVFSEAASGSGWSTAGDERASAPTWSRAASTTTSSRAPTRSTRARSRPSASTTPASCGTSCASPQGTGRAIGFHDIPVDDGAPVQTVAQLGTPQSHGCIRQTRPDAIAPCGFAPVGTKVVVTA